MSLFVEKVSFEEFVLKKKFVGWCRKKKIKGFYSILKLSFILKRFSKRKYRNPF